MDNTSPRSLSSNREKAITKDEFADLLREIAVLMRLSGENDFRAMAFDRAARTLENLGEDLHYLLREKKLTDLKGIGKSIAADLYTYEETGRIPVLEKLRDRISPDLVSWLDIPGLGPKKIFRIHQALGITRRDELEEKCRDGSLAALAGMGQKTADKILKSLEWIHRHSERCRIDEATSVAQIFLESLNHLPGVQAISTAGSLRRRLETIGDIDLLIAAEMKYAESIMEHFTGQENVVEVLAKGQTKSSVRTEEGRQADLRIVSKDHYPAALLYFTGSKEHNVVLRQRARDRHLQLNEYGLFHQDQNGRADTERPLQASSEEDLYRHLDLGYIPPELREDHDEFSLYDHQAGPRLLLPDDIRGILHAHSTWSDGKNSISDMAEACHEKGFQYLAITDHSKTAAYAGGLSIRQVYEQWREIDKINEDYFKKGIDFQILKGIESDILPDGSLDYPDEILKGFDLVIASVHSALDQEPGKMLERLKKAAGHRFVHLIGHPTGRLLLKRDGNAVDLSRLIPFAARQHTAIEINANPWRLDLDWRYGKVARDSGMMSAICPDAHHISGLDDLHFGIGIARKAGFGPSQILNTFSLKQLADWLKKKK